VVGQAKTPPVRPRRARYLRKRQAAGGAQPAAADAGVLRVAAVERGRTASLGGTITALIWLVILV
jgi:hypothetical protein